MALNHPMLWPLMVVVWILWIVPLFRLFGRAGFNPAWAFVALFPPLGMLALWILAFARWPADAART
jgi:hypothetical protein